MYPPFKQSPALLGNSLYTEVLSINLNNLNVQNITMKVKYDSINLCALMYSISICTHFWVNLTSKFY